MPPDGLEDALLQGALDTAIVGIDPAGAITAWSRGAHRILGWPPSEAMGRPFAMLFTPDDQQAGIPESALRATAEAGHSHEERWHARQGGGKLWAGAELVRKPDGAGWIMLLRDRSGQYRVREDRREAQRLNTLIMNASRDCIVVLDMAGRMQFLSHGAIAAFELDSGTEHLGAPWLDVWTAHDVPAARMAVEEARAGRTGRFRGCIQTRAGLARWWDVIVSPLAAEDGQPEGIVTVGRDITEATLAEQLLALSEERLSLALDAAEMVGIWDYDLLHSTIYGDANFARLQNIDAARTKAGVPINEVFDNFHPDDAASFRAQIRLLLDGSDTFAIEHRLLQPDGDVRWVLARGRLVRARDLSPTRLTGVMVDITEHRRAAERQRLLTQEMAHRVKNSIAVVQSIARQTLRGEGAIAIGREAFIDRLMALADAHDVLLQGDWTGASLQTLVEKACRAHTSGVGERFVAAGPEIRLGSRAALSFVLVLHELFTNAAKYGSLSTAHGLVHVSWTIDEGAGPPTLHFCWQESLGPPVQPPAQAGFGTRLIERSLATELGAVARLDYRPEGVCLTLDTPIEGLLRD